MSDVQKTAAGPEAPEPGFQGKRQKGKAGRYALISLAVVVCAAVVLGVVYFVLNEKQTREFDEGLYQFHVGQRVDIAAPSSLNEGEADPVLVGGGVEVPLDSRPLYVSGRPALYLPAATMAVLPLRQGSLFKLEPFSEVVYENDIAVITTASGSHPVEEGFIYDGANRYLFLTEVDVLIGDQSYHLSPLSYIDVEYGNLTTIYDYQADEATVLETGQTPVSVQRDNDVMPYTIQADTDTLIYGSTEQLLLSDPTLLDPLSE